MKGIKDIKPGKLRRQTAVYIPHEKMLELSGKKYKSFEEYCKKLENDNIMKKDNKSIEQDELKKKK